MLTFETVNASEEGNLSLLSTQGCELEEKKIFMVCCVIF